MIPDLQYVSGLVGVSLHLFVIAQQSSIANKTLMANSKSSNKRSQTSPKTQSESSNDKDVNQDNYRRTVQPVLDREVLPEKHTAKPPRT
ncbi:hypothetical protein PTMSG1_10077 [Pyrenophora teres f. maculata]|nr:hypothetical protein PTMSG1_10077 [Pyrenophora teres f. maculata]